MLEPYREFSPERAQTLNRLGDALLLGMAAFAAARENGVFHWKVAIALFAVATALWFVASRGLDQYRASGRGFFGDVALTLVMITAVSVPICVLGTVLQ